MSRRLLSGFVLVLIITNLLTLILWNKDKPEDERNDITIDNNDPLYQIDTDKPVAAIDDEEITYEEWNKSLRKEYGEKELKKMVDTSVVTQLAEKEDIEVDEKVIERELALLRMTQGIMSKDELEKKEEEWKEDIIFRYQLEKLLTEDVSIPDEEIKQYYNDYHNQYDFQAAAQLSHIVVSDEETAEKVVKELDDEASFSLLAKEYSLDEDSRENGGYMGFLERKSQYFPDEYLEKTQDMEEHTYSDPIQTDEGYAIVYLHSKLPEISFSYDEMKPYVKAELALDESNKNLDADELWDQLDIDWIFGEKKEEDSD